MKLDALRWAVVHKSLIDEDEIFALCYSERDAAVLCEYRQAAAAPLGELLVVLPVDATGASVVFTPPLSTRLK